MELFGLGSNPKTFEFKCTACGEIHRGSPSFGYNKPGEYYSVPEAEIARAVTLTEDLCTIAPPMHIPDGETAYFIRTTLDIPIDGADEPFTWGVWVSQSKESFERYRDSFSDDQTGEGSFGWLGVWMPPYNRRTDDEPIEYLSCDVDWGAAGLRPTVMLQECDHPLYSDQQNGLSWDRAIEIAMQIMHGKK
ncbi:MAG: DUF2199 domain-containing protein [Pseudomonadota bacterium]